ncbi:hypothetical protein PCANB_001208 [Pneumocystis canis]|nr:hypothetical protein PCANB_001208 [Pneumocystis canis]
MDLIISDIEMDHEKENDCKEFNRFSSELRNNEKSQDFVVYKSEITDILEVDKFIERNKPFGVEEMSIEDVREYCVTYYLVVSSLIEWIDDSSYNLAYPDASTALSAFSSICQPTIDTLYIDSLVPAKINPKHKNIHLFIRHSKISDRKVPGAGERSRWYLFHPHSNIKFLDILISEMFFNATGFLLKKDKSILLSMMRDSSSIYSNYGSRMFKSSVSLTDIFSKNNIELFPEKFSRSKILNSLIDVAIPDELNKISHKELFFEKLENLICKELFFEKPRKSSYNQLFFEELNETFRKELFPEKLLKFQKQNSYISCNIITKKTSFTLNIKGFFNCRNKVIDIF